MSGSGSAGVLPLSWQRGMGAVLLAVWLGMLWQKAAAHLLPELAWLCHVSSLALALALLANWRRLLAVAFLLQWAVAVPVYVLWLAQGGHSHVLSLALHVAAPLFGALACWRMRVPALAVGLAFGTALSLWLLTRIFMSPHMNVNFAVQPLILLAQEAGWMNWIADFLLLGAMLGLWRQFWNARWWIADKRERGSGG